MSRPGRLSRLRRLSGFFDLRRLCGLGRALPLRFFSGLPGSDLFLGFALQFLGRAKFFLRAKARLFDLAFALLDILALASFDQSARTGVDLASR